MHFNLHDEAGTIALGAALAQALIQVHPHGLNIHLHGDLGAGKTTLTRAILQRLGYTGHVKSPTYTLVETYQFLCHFSHPIFPIDLMHFDLYRLTDPNEFLEAGFRDYFNTQSLCIVEWPEKGEGVLPIPDIAVFFHIKQVTQRSLMQGRAIELKPSSDKGRLCLSRLQFAPNL